jgi:hypothetical protein
MPVANDWPASSVTVLVSTVRRLRAGTGSIRRVVRPAASTKVMSTFASTVWGLATASRVLKNPLVAPSARYFW